MRGPSVVCILLVLCGAIPPAAAQDVVVQADPDYAWVLGPVLRGPSPWPWYDVTEAAATDILAPVMTTPPTVIGGPGTITVTAPPNIIDGGTGFVTTAPGNAGVIWTGVGTNFTQADVGTRIVVQWDADRDGSHQGRRVVYIAAVNSPTAIVASDYYMTEPPADFSRGLSWGRLGESYYPYDANHAASQNAMFYEAGLAVGRLYAKTGQARYWTQFHTFCNNWWRWGLGSGWGVPIPRNAGLHTMIACAADPSYREPPGMWDGLARLTMRIAGQVTTSTGGQVGYNPTSPAVRGETDVRELSYVLRYTALLARTYGAHGGSTSTWCGYLANQVTNLWLATAVVPVGALHQNYAYWEENLFAMNPGYIAASSPAGDPNGRFGTSPWRATGLPTLALIYAYEALSDPRTCNNATLAAQLFTPTNGSGLIANAARFIWDYGRSPDGGVFYNVGYESDTGNVVGGTVISNTPGVTVTVTNGSAQVVGTGTTFTTLFASSLGPTYIGLLGTPEVNRRVYRVQSVTDSTHLTLNLPYAGPSATIGYFGRAVQADTDCGPRTLTRFCEKDRYSGRNLAADIGASAAWLYKQTGDPIWKARTEYYGNKTFGGAAGGSGSVGPPTGTCVGDVASNCADGGHGNLGEILPNCGSSPAPCGEGALNPKYGKPLGMASGAGDTPGMIANLLAPPSSNKPIMPPTGCRYDVFFGTQVFGATGGATTVLVMTQPGCRWTITDDGDWLSVAPTRGTGTQTNTLTVRGFSGVGSRSASVVVAGQVFVVQQRR